VIANLPGIPASSALARKPLHMGNRRFVADLLKRLKAGDYEACVSPAEIAVKACPLGFVQEFGIRHAQSGHQSNEDLFRDPAGIRGFQRGGDRSGSTRVLEIQQCSRNSILCRLPEHREKDEGGVSDLRQNRPALGFICEGEKERRNKEQRAGDSEDEERPPESMSYRACLRAAKE
jgi:hypothetical protein